MRPLLLLPLLFACVPDEPAEGEGEGEGDVACVDVVTVFDRDVCVDASAGENDLHLAGEDGDVGVDLTVSAFGPLRTPQELDQTNASCFATFARGDERYSVATGAIGGAPVGDCHVVIENVDDAEFLAVDGDGFAAKDGDALAGPLFFTFKTRL